MHAIAHSRRHLSWRRKRVQRYRTAPHEKVHLLLGPNVAAALADWEEAQGRTLHAAQNFTLEALWRDPT